MKKNTEIINSLHKELVDCDDKITSQKMSIFFLFLLLLSLELSKMNQRFEEQNAELLNLIENETTNYKLLTIISEKKRKREDTVLSCIERKISFHRDIEEKIRTVFLPFVISL